MTNTSVISDQIDLVNGAQIALQITKSAAVEAIDACLQEDNPVTLRIIEDDEQRSGIMTLSGTVALGDGQSAAIRVDVHHYMNYVEAITVTRMGGELFGWDATTPNDVTFSVLNPAEVRTYAAAIVSATKHKCSNLLNFDDALLATARLMED